MWRQAQAPWIQLELDHPLGLGDIRVLESRNLCVPTDLWGSHWGSLSCQHMDHT